jgi:uncharacterized protein YjiS (DUF1127 family)
MNTTTDFPQYGPNGVDLHRAARSRRSRQLAVFLKAALQRSVALAARICARWQQHRQQRATYFALTHLDSRTLRDLGFDRSEILSVAAEIAGCTDPTRVLRRRPDTARP